MSTKLYSFDDHPADRDQLPIVAAEWNANALSTARYTAEDKERIKTRIFELYKVTGLAAPEKIAFVKSPLAGGILSTVVSAYLHLRDNKAEREELFEHPIDPDHLAREAAASAAIAFDWYQKAFREENPTPISLSKDDLSKVDATKLPYYQEFCGLLYGETGLLSFKPDRAAEPLSDLYKHEIRWFFMAATRHWGKFYDGGNLWSGWASFLYFFRTVAKLPLDWEKWIPYEDLARFGPRFSHEKFVIVCDRPLEIHQDEQERAHNPRGPYISWEDGTALYRIAGLVVSAEQVQDGYPATEIFKVENVELRRVLVDRHYGGDLGKYCDDLGLEIIDRDTDECGGERTLRRLEQRDDNPVMVLTVTSPTLVDGKVHKATLTVHPEIRPLAVPGVRNSLGDPQKPTCHNAVASTFGFYGHEWKPEIQT